MGSHNSHNMEDDNLHSTAYESEDNSEWHYAEIIQMLINSGRSLVCNDGYDYEGQMPKIYRPCVKKLIASEFYFETKLSSGLLSSNRKPVGNNITSMLLNRERNMCPYEKFSKPNKSRIQNWFLPNTMEELDHYEGKVFCGVFTKDGKYFITGSQDQMLRIYDSSGPTYKLYNKVQGRDIGWSVLDIALSPDQQYFAYSTWSPQVHLCPVEDKSDKQIPLNVVNGSRRFAIFSLGFTSDGRVLLGGGNDGYCYIYDIDQNQRILAIQAHDNDINSVVFADDSSHIIYSGGDDGLIKVWDLRTMGEDCKPVGLLAGHKDGITYISTRGDSRYLISNSKDQSIKLWDVRIFSSQSAVENTQTAVRGQTWDYRWQEVPNRLFNAKDVLPGDSSIMTYKGHVVTNTLLRCKFSPAETTGQRYIYTGCGLGRLIIYDTLTGKIKRSMKKHSLCIRDVSWHPVKNEIVTCSWDKTIGLWSYNYRDSDERLDDGDTDGVGRKGEKLRRSLRIALQRLRNADPESDSDDE